MGCTSAAVLVMVIAFASLTTIHTCTFSKETTSWAKERMKVIGSGYSSECDVLSGSNMAKEEFDTDSSHKPVFVFLFHKDEEQLLSDWLQYHSYLFSPRNITVIDDKSESHSICKLLALYRHCGLNVISTPPNFVFNAKSGALTNAMSAYGKKDDTFLLPMDTDEFLVLRQHRVPKEERNHTIQYNMSVSAIRGFIDNLPVDGRKYKVRTADANRLADRVSCESALNSNDSTYRRTLQRGPLDTKEWHKKIVFARDKTFYSARSFVTTDQGNHCGTVKLDHGKRDTTCSNRDTFHDTRLSYIHLRMGTFNSTINKAFRGSQAYKFNLSSPSVRCAADGAHYCSESKKIIQQGIYHYKQQLFQKCLAKTLSNETRNTGFRWQLPQMTTTEHMNQWFAKHAKPMDWLVGP